MNKQSFLCILCLFCIHNLHAGWHDRKAEGWAWYEDRQRPEEQSKNSDQSATSSEEMKQMKEIMEEKLAKAVLEPTPENIKSYMEEQQKWLERSSHFANVWAQLLLNNPHLDYTATHLPISQYGLQFYKKEIQEKKERLIASLVKDFGLFFFYEGRSQTALLFANIVRAFSKKYGWEIIAISLDDVQIEGFENRRNNGIAEALEVDVTPALYLINPKMDEAIPISFGLVAMDKLEDNIALQFKDLIQ